MKILFTTNYPAPYRVDFFNELGKYVDLTVLYEYKKASHRDEKWTGNQAVNFSEKYMDLGMSYEKQRDVFQMSRYISKNKYDFIVFGGYASLNIRFAISYCRVRKIKYWIEFDGGFLKKDSILKRLFKIFFVKGAEGNFVPCEETEQYLLSLGVNKSKIFKYPFSSLYSNEILEAPLSREDKAKKKIDLGINEKIAILSVGRFIPGKGIDVLLKAIDTNIELGVYVVGGKPTEEYLDICKSRNLKNVHFVEFCKKSEIIEWYKACDLFVFPTRKDVWGLVINEAMACGLPIISSDMAIAARELIKHGHNGFIFKSDDDKDLSEYINKALSSNLEGYSNESLQIIRNYTIEKMAEKHIEVWKRFYEVCD